MSVNPRKLVLKTSGRTLPLLGGRGALRGFSQRVADIGGVKALSRKVKPSGAKLSRGGWDTTSGCAPRCVCCLPHEQAPQRQVAPQRLPYASAPQQYSRRCKHSPAKPNVSIAKLAHQAAFSVRGAGPVRRAPGISAITPLSQSLPSVVTQPPTLKAL